MILTVSSFALAHKQSRSVSKNELKWQFAWFYRNWQKLCLHDYMVVTVTVTKIYGKNEF